jgi:ATP-binding cassette, subfamily B, bacterial PglK
VETQQLIGYLLSFFDILVNASILVAILITILLVDFVTSLVAAVVFGTIYVLLTLYFRKTIRRKGEERNSANQERVRYATEGLNSYKTTKVMGVEGFYLSNYMSHSMIFAKANSFSVAAATVPRYIIEAIAAGGIVLFVLIEISLGRPLEALAPLIGLFGLAGYRMLPALQAVYNPTPE